MSYFPSRFHGRTVHASLVIGCLWAHAQRSGPSPWCRSHRWWNAVLLPANKDVPAGVGGLLKPSCERLLNKHDLCWCKMNAIRRLGKESLGGSKNLHKLYPLVIFIGCLSLGDKEIIRLPPRIFCTDQLADSVCVPLIFKEQTSKCLQKI